MTEREHEADWPTDDGAPPPVVQRALKLARQGDSSSAQVGRLEAALARRLGASSLREVEPSVSTRGASLFAKSALLKFGVVLAVGLAGAWAWLAEPSTRRELAAVEPTLPSTPEDKAAQPTLPSTPEDKAVEAPEPAPAAVTSAPVARLPKPAGVPRPSGAAGAPNTSSEDPLAREAALMMRAHAQLKTDPAAALSTTAVHRRRYPQGVLTQERETVAIQALRALGRIEEAELRARGLKEAFPSLPYLKASSRSTEVEQ